MGNFLPVAKFRTAVPRATAFWCLPQRFFDGGVSEETQRVPFAVAALH
jgi:hypothetical protein